VALPHYIRAVSINPRNIQALNNMGNIYFRTGNLDQAAAAYEQILSTDAQHVPAMTLLAQVYLGQQRADEAIPVLKRAASLDGDWAPAHQGLAEAYKQIGEVALSEEHRAKAYKLTEENQQ
jgi:tetratricopeptide (TPR) repeat protein